MLRCFRILFSNFYRKINSNFSMAQNDNFKPGTIVRFKNFKQKSEMNNSYGIVKQKLEKGKLRCQINAKNDNLVESKYCEPVIQCQNKYRVCSKACYQLKCLSISRASYQRILISMFRGFRKFERQIRRKSTLPLFKKC